MFHSPRWTVLCEYRLLYKLFSISCVHSGRCRVNVTDVSVCQYAYAMNGDFKYFNKFLTKMFISIKHQEFVEFCEIFCKYFLYSI